LDKKQLLWIALLTVSIVLLLRGPLRCGRDEEGAKTPSAEKQETRQADGWAYDGAGLSGADLSELAGKTYPRVYLGSLDEEKDGYKFQVELDPRGASIYTIKLAGHFDTVDHKKKKDKSPEDRQDWSYPLLNPVHDGDELVLPFSTQAVKIDGVGELSTFMSRPGEFFLEGSSRPIRGRIAWEAGDFKDEGDSQSVSFTLKLEPPGAQVPTTQPDTRAASRSTSREAGGEITSRPATRPQPPERRHLELVKTYRLSKGSDRLEISLKLVNKTGEDRTLSIVQYGPTGVPKEDVRGDQRNIMLGQYISKEKKITIDEDGVEKRDDANKLDRYDTRELGDNRKDEAKPAVWAGHANKFFACLMYPVSKKVKPTEDTSIDVDDDTAPADLVVPAGEQYAYVLRRRVLQEDKTSKTQLIVLETDPKLVKAGESLSVDLDVYLGPKNKDVFDDVPLYAKLGYAEAIQFQSCSTCLIKPLAFGVMWFIEKIGGFMHNYGLAIILLVAMIRLALLPISKRSQVNMMKTAKMGPEMKKLQEKYKDDKQAQQKAMMELFKQQGISPILGCVPMLLQLPIWIALWAGLGASVPLRHSGLLPFWITDLAGTDAVIQWTPVHVPLLSMMMGPISSLNILPLLLAVFMFLQQKISPMQAAAGAQTPEQKQQQKVMMYMMSGMMLLFFYNAPSGLTLYIMASTAVGVAEARIIRKHIKEKEALEAAMETKIHAPGKAPRGQRPKKPKGPTFFKYK